MDKGAPHPPHAKRRRVAGDGDDGATASKVSPLASGMGRRDGNNGDGHSATARGKGGRPVYPHGNYPAYYAKRLPGGATDPRLVMLKRKWFEGRRVLDVGCNVGVVTVDLVRRLGAAEAVGVDVDPSLVRRARAAAAALPHPRDDELAAEELGVPWIPVSLSGGIGPVQTMASAVRFVCADFADDGSVAGGRAGARGRGSGDGEGAPAAAADADPIAGQFDAVVCLSTSKWVHLNRGDRGVKRLFARAHAALKPGGVFVLEPQMWKSYRNARGTTPTIDANFKSIELRPSQFVEYLTGPEVGFARVETLGTITAADGSTFGSGKGAQRAIYAFFK